LVSDTQTGVSGPWDMHRRRMVWLLVRRGDGGSGGDECGRGDGSGCEHHSG
jgi:hypothetical protein